MDGPVIQWQKITSYSYMWFEIQEGAECNELKKNSTHTRKLNEDMPTDSSHRCLCYADTGAPWKAHF